MRVKQSGNYVRRVPKFVTPVGSRLGVRTLDLACPTCGAEVGAGCTTIESVDPKPTSPHTSRLRMARRKRNEIRGL